MQAMSISLRPPRAKVVALSITGFLYFASFAAAQTITGEITGTVVDQSDAVVPGAAVELVREGTSASRVGTTNPAGIFMFPALSPGTYTLKVNSAGFRSFEQSGIVLSASERVAVGQIRLEVGGAAEKVTISAETSQVQTETIQTSARLNPEISSAEW